MHKSLCPAPLKHKQTRKKEIWNKNWYVYAPIAHCKKLIFFKIAFNYQLLAFVCYVTKTLINLNQVLLVE